MKKAGWPPCRKSLILLVEQRGIEPLTSALRTRRSAKLSYCPTRISILPFQVSGFKFQVGRNAHKDDSNRGKHHAFRSASSLCSKEKRRQGWLRTAPKGC